jgi:hypothetical protein
MEFSSLVDRRFPQGFNAAIFIGLDSEYPGARTPAPPLAWNGGYKIGSLSGVRITLPFFAVNGFGFRHGASTLSAELFQFR